MPQLNLSLDDLRKAVKDITGEAQDTARLNWMETHAASWSQVRGTLTFWHLNRKYTVAPRDPLTDNRTEMRQVIDQAMRDYP